MVCHTNVHAIKILKRKQLNEDSIHEYYRHMRKIRGLESGGTIYRTIKEINGKRSIIQKIAHSKHIQIVEKRKKHTLISLGLLPRH